MPGSKLSKGDIFDDSFFQALNQADKELKELLTTFNKLAKQAKEVSKGISAAKTFNEVAKAAKKTTDATTKLTAEEKKLQSATKALVFEQSKAGREYAKINEKKKQAAQANRNLARSQDTTRKSTNRWGIAIKSFQFKFNALGNLIANAASTVFRGFIRAVRKSVDIIKNFDSSSAKLASVLGQTRKETEGLTKAAKQLGSTTQWTATQVTSLQIELAKLGFTSKEINKSTPAILSFATATGANLADAAKTAGAALRVFGLNAAETEATVASLAVATTKSGLTFEHFDTILSTVGPVAKAYGFKLEDVVALTGELATAGFEANKAATATRNILLNLADSNGALAKSLGRSVGNFDDLIDGLVELEMQGVPLGEMLELTDKRSVAAFSRFLEGAEAARELRDGITDVTGELQKMVGVQLDTLAGDVDLLNSALEGTALSRDGGFLRKLVQFATNATLQINNLGLAFTKFHKQTDEQLTQSFDLLEALTNKQGERFSFVTDSLDQMDLVKVGSVDMFEHIVSLFQSIRSVNAKEAVALADEYLRRRFADANDEVEYERIKNERLAKEEEKKALLKENKSKEAARIAQAEADEILRIKEESVDALAEEDQKFIDMEIKAREDVVSATAGAFAELEAIVGDEFDAEMDVLGEKRKAYQEYYDFLRERAEQSKNDIQVDIANAGFDILSGLLERKEIAIDKQLANGVISEEKAAKEKAKIQRKAAIVEKAQSLFNIAITTAEGVMKYASNPLTAPLVPWIIGLGVAQAAAVIAEPIPAFFKGTDSAPGGLAVAGEEGSELLVGPDGKIGLTPDSATLMDIDKGTKIFPSDVTKELLRYIAIANGVGPSKDDRIILAVMQKMDRSNERLYQAIKNKPVTSSSLTPAGIRTLIHKGNTTVKRIDKYFK